MPQIKAPRLYLNRCGVFYFRLKTKEKDRKISLRTKCPVTANIVALQLNAVIERGRAMKNKKTNNPDLADFNFDLDALKTYEIEFRGAKIKAEGPEDHARAMEALSKMEQVLPAVPTERELLAEQERKIIEDFISKSTPTPSLKISEVQEQWIAERALKNKPRTVNSKKYHFKDFITRALKNEDVEINSLNKASIANYKKALLKEGQTGKTIDNKLLTLMDFFDYAMNQGFYTVDNSNPVSGLFVLTKRERVKMTKSYEPFAPIEITTLFEPLAYKQAMKAPDLFWGPLLGLYTGMRIGEATQIRCEDVKLAENGVHYIYIYESKTQNGIRKVPVADALIQLGFLDYVEEVRAAGAKRIFPHRSFVNGSYSKRLSEEFLKYLTARNLKQADDRKSFHSFRVNVITQLANNGVSATLASRIAGHGTEKGIDVHLGYVRDLPDLKNAIDTLVWPIDLQGLRYQGEFKELVANKKKWAD